MYQATIMEYEPGWGTRIDEIREFDTREERDAFIENYNKANDNKTSREWCMYAVEG